MPSYTVRFEPSGLRCHCTGELTLLEAAQKSGLSIPAICGGAGTCGKCRVTVHGDLTPPTEVERKFLTPKDLRSGIRLACQAHPRGDVVVTVDHFEKPGQILTRGIRRPLNVNPAVRKHWVRIDPPTLDANPFDWEDFVAAIPDSVKLSPQSAWALEELPRRLRRWGFAGTVVVVDGQFVDFERGDTRSECYGLAIDLGTTTIVVKLVGLISGVVEAVASAVNPQRVYGEDVVSRIQASGKDRRTRKEIQKLAVRAINELARRTMVEGGVKRGRVYEAVIVGNTAMLHLLVGADATFLAEYPYVPAFRGPLSIPAKQIGLRIHPHGWVTLLPAIGRFVGADTVGVLLATDLLNREDLTLVVDIGTNGEIVLGNRGGAVACSTAAGPAFEGATITHGMRAEAGAIDTVWLEDGELKYHVIGETRPRGICGSGVIDLVALLLSAGVVEETGRLLGPSELPETVPTALRQRVRQSDNGPEFVVAEDGESQITLNQRDVREVQLAKGAIATGIDLLLREAGVELDQVGQVLVAGGFGNYIRPQNAVRIGLLPRVPLERIRFVGNAALTGAEMALLSRKARADAETVAHTVRYIEIAAKPEFQDTFATNMLFPSAEEVPAVWTPARQVGV